MLYYLPFITMGIFLFIGLVFVYIFLFRGPRAAVTNAIEAQLARLDAEETNERTTLLWHTEEPRAGQLRAVVIWLDGYEAIDPVRQVISRRLDDYLATEADVRWRESWTVDDYEAVLQASQQTFESQLAALQQAGWEAKLGLPFSERDQLVYLAR